MINVKTKMDKVNYCCSSKEWSHPVWLHWWFWTRNDITCDFVPGMIALVILNRENGTFSAHFLSLSLIFCLQVIHSIVCFAYKYVLFCSHSSFILHESSGFFCNFKYWKHSVSPILEMSVRTPSYDFEYYILKWFSNPFHKKSYIP